MIPRLFISEWSSFTPWQKMEMVEQDLILSRAIIDIFNDPLLQQKVAFRGGTALHKLYLRPPARYSEDIDLVQVNAEPVGSTIDRFRLVLSYLGEPVRKQKDRNTTLIYRFRSETPPTVPLRLKIEINCREHFTVFGYRQIPYQINSRWFSGGGNIVTYSLEELLGSKLRALFQRKKGRDLFDIWYCLKYQKVDVHNLISAFDGFLKHDKRTILKDEFLDNIADKISDPDFRNDTTGLIRPEIDYDLEKCWNLVRSIFLPVMKPELGLHSK